MKKQIVAFDTETALIRPGCYAPPLVCLTWQALGKEAEIVTHDSALIVARAWLRDPHVEIVGHNVAYDLGVLCAEFPELVPLTFQAYADDRVTDTKIRQQLYDIASGQYRGANEVKLSYDLASLTKNNLGRTLKKDGWRLRYASFRGVPLDQWEATADAMIERAAIQLADRPDDKDLLELVECTPEEVITYPLEDARSTLENWIVQEKHALHLPDQYAQARAAWWLHLCSAWGLRTREEAVEALRAETLGDLAEIEDELIAAGLVRADGSRDTKKAAALMVEVCAQAGVPLRKTDKGGICLDADACQNTEDPILMKYADLTTLKTVLAKDIPALASGSTYPIHTSFGLAASGRTTSSRPNVQNWRRKASRPDSAGVRECFIPRPGKVFAQADYDQLELRTLGQVCVTLFGKSSLADALNAGIDPHLALGAEILGIPYEEAKANRKRPDVDNARQTAKVANFGFPGGLGLDSLIAFAKKSYGVELTKKRADELKTEWLKRWPEMREFFAHCSKLSSVGTVEQLFSGRIRGGCSYTAACNSWFQGLGADATKHAGFLISRACYADPKSPLWGSRIVNYVHDEFILETADGPGAHDVAIELARLMIEGANEYLPDVPANTEPLLMRYWSKDAKPVHDATGRLIPWGDT